jgi:acetyl esterase/lipase
MATYDPDAIFDVDVSDVEYLRVDGVGYLARVYRPKGPGPFPVLVDIHGGAWSGSDRLTNEVTSLPLSQSGLVVVSIDFRIAPEHPYPAQVQDANYAVSWLKAHAGEFGGDGYFLTEEAMREGNPQEIIERGEQGGLPPVQVVHGSADTNVPLHLVERFAENYQSAGGELELEVFPDQPHTFAAKPGPLTDEAVGVMKCWIAMQI